MSQIAIEPIGPFSWPAALDVLNHFQPMQRHSIGAPDAIRMGFCLDRDFTPGAVALRFEDGALKGQVAGISNLDAVARQVARIFSLDHDGTDYPAIGERDRTIGRVMNAFPGLRPLCFTSPYETAAWAIISQRISMRQAARIQDDLIAEHGHRVRVDGYDVSCFPRPERLAVVESIAGLSSEKVERLRLVARAALDGLLDAERLRALGDEAGPASLLALRGIGPFWSQGIYLRGCGIADVFPNEPLSIAALGHLNGLGDRPSATDVARLAEAFKPFRMWVCFLLRVAAGRGLIEGVVDRERMIRRGSRSADRYAPLGGPPSISAAYSSALSSG